MTDKEIIEKLENVRYHLPAGERKAVIDEAIESIRTLTAEIEKLEEKLSYEIADGGASCHLCLKVHTDKKIKQFAEKLKKNLTGWETNATDEEIEYCIERVTTEMVGERNAEI